MERPDARRIQPGSWALGFGSVVTDLDDCASLSFGGLGLYALGTLGLGFVELWGYRV